MYAYQLFYACKSNDRLFRYKIELNALIQFGQILVDIQSICSWSFLVNCMEMKPMFFTQQTLDLT